MRAIAHPRLNLLKIYRRLSRLLKDCFFLFGTTKIRKTFYVCKYTHYNFTTIYNYYLPPIPLHQSNYFPLFTLLFILLVLRSNTDNTAF